MLAQNGIEYKNSHSDSPLWLLPVLRPPAFGAGLFMGSQFLSGEVLPELPAQLLPDGGAVPVDLGELLLDDGVLLQVLPDEHQEEAHRQQDAGEPDGPGAPGSGSPGRRPGRRAG